MRAAMFAMLVFLIETGCSREQLIRAGYDMVKQESCREGISNIPNEQALHLDCVTSASKEGMSYEDYQKARSNSSGNSDPVPQNPR